MSVAYVAWDQQDAMMLYEMVLGGSMLPICLCLKQSIRSPHAEHLTDCQPRI